MGKKGKELTLDFEAVWLNNQRADHLRQFAAFLTGRQVIDGDRQSRV